MPSTFDPFANGSATEVGKNPSGFDPFTSGSASANTEGDQALGPNSNWSKLYGGIEGMDDRLDDHQKLAMASLDKVSDNPKETRAQAVNQAYLQTKIKGMNPEVMQRNWGAVKDEYAKQQFGFVGKDITDSALYGQISQRMQAEDKEYAEKHAVLREPTTFEKIENIKPWTLDHTIGEDLYRTKHGLEEFSKSLEAFSISDLPRAPDDLPDMQKLGPVNPALVGAVWNSLQPLVKDLGTLPSIATFGTVPAVAELAKVSTAAKVAFGSMTAVFTGLMGSSAVQQNDKVQKVLKDPNATFQQKATEVSSAVVQSALTALAPLSAALEMMPEAQHVQFIESVKGKNPAEVAELIRNEAKDTDIPGHSDVLHEAAQALDKISTVPDRIKVEDEISKGTPLGQLPPDHIPVTIERPDGTQYQAAMRSYWETPDGEIPGIGRMTDDGWSHGMLNPGEKIVNAIPSPEEWRAGVREIHAPKPAPIEAEPMAAPVAVSPEVTETAKEPISATSNEGGALGIKNADIDAQMRQMGLPEATRAEKTSWERANNDATSKMEADPQAGEKLVAELAANNRPVDSNEVALLTQEMNRLKVQRQDAEATLIEAEKSGKPEAIEAVKLEIARTRDAFQRAADVTKKSGTISGQALAARQIMVNEDYSLAAMEHRRVVANEGKPLSAEQETSVRELNQKLAEAQAKIDAYEKQRQAAKDEPLRVAPKRPKPPAKVADFLSRQADQARLRIKDRIGRLNTGIDPTELIDHAIIGADYLAKGVTKFADWSAAMVNDLGEYIRPHLQEIFKQAVEQRDQAEEGQALEAQKDRIEGQIAKREALLKSGDVSTPAKPVNRPSSPELERARQRLEEVNAKIKEMREGPQLTDEERKLQGYKTRKQRDIDGLKQRLASGDFTKADRKAVQLDLEAERLKADYERLKRREQLEVQKIEDANRSFGKKAADLALNINRAGVLSRVAIIGKLSAIIAERSIATPIRQAVGYGVGKLLPGVAKQARFEDVPTFGGLVRSESKAITAMITKGLPGAWDILRMKDTDLQASFEKEHLPAGALSYPSHIHGALHYPIQVADYTRRLQLITERDIRAGIDMTEPINQVRNMQEAWEYSKRSVFLQKNKLADAYKGLVKTLESPEKESGKPNPAAKTLAFLLQAENPVLKIPLNFAEELGEHIFGLLDPPVRLALKGVGGFKGLSYGEADMVLRHVKNGALGSALVLLGFFKYKQVGGFYEEGEKRKKSDVTPGAARIGKTDIPALLLKDTSMEAMMAGATMHRTLDSVYRLNDPKKKGIPAALLATAAGIAGEVPFVRDASIVGKVMDPKQREHAIAADIASKLVPGVIQEAAQQTDKKHAYNFFEPSNSRKITEPDFGGALKQELEKEIPGLREKLPKRDINTSFRQ